MPPHVLIVDDELSIAEALAAGLGAQGLRCSHVLSAAQALAVLARERPDCILLDVGLPDQSGFDLLPRIKALWPNVPVLLLTARTEEVDRVLGLELGADDYIAKPFSLREVAARIRARLRRTTAPAGHAVFHERGGRVFALGRALELTASEYSILSALLRNPEHILSREQLLDTLGSGADVTDRTIDTHMKTLRAKLRAAGLEEQWIRTHRGLGYSLALTPSAEL